MIFPAKMMVAGCNVHAMPMSIEGPNKGTRRFAAPDNHAQNIGCTPSCNAIALPRSFTGLWRKLRMYVLTPRKRRSVRFAGVFSGFRPAGLKFKNRPKHSIRPMCRCDFPSFFASSSCVQPLRWNKRDRSRKSRLQPYLSSMIAGRTGSKVCAMLRI